MCVNAGSPVHAWWHRAQKGSCPCQVPLSHRTQHMLRLCHTTLHLRESQTTAPCVCLGHLGAMQGHFLGFWVSWLHTVIAGITDTSEIPGPSFPCSELHAIPQRVLLCISAFHKKSFHSWVFLSVLANWHCSKSVKQRIQKTEVNTARARLPDLAWERRVERQSELWKLHTLQC